MTKISNLSAFEVYKNAGILIPNSKRIKKSRKPKNNILIKEDYDRIENELKSIPKNFIKSPSVLPSIENLSRKNLQKSHKKEKKAKIKKSKNTLFSEKSLTPIEPPSISKKKNNQCHKDESSSIYQGNNKFQWIIHPIQSDLFFQRNFEKKHLHLKRSNPNYYSNLLSTKDFHDALRDQYVLFGKNLDVTTFENDVRENHAPDEGRAYPSVVWDFYNNGCSLRLLNPATFFEPVWKLCSVLQDYFGSMVGANMYLTPPGTQGFAPHFDDVEVFILQLEGKKRWRLYENPKPLPRFSSRNYSQSEMNTPVLDTILEAGDFLYMPKGTFHQGNCLEDSHSLHLTISCHQLHSYGDFLNKTLSRALEKAIGDDLEFRKSLPMNYMSFLGTVRSSDEGRSQFKRNINSLLSKLPKYISIDSGADEMSKEFLKSSLPPYLSSSEKKRSVSDGGEMWNKAKSCVVNRVEIDPNTPIRLVRAYSMRVIEDDGNLRLYFNTENTREYHQIEQSFLEIDSDLKPAMELLVKSYPEYVKVHDLPLNDESLKFTLVQNLWEKNLLITQKPLEAHYDD